MADVKITALTALTAADPANDVIPIVDVSDTTMAASGTTKKISVNNILGASGTATLASATITGDLTAARLIVTGGTIPTNGLWLATTNTLEFAANSLAQYRIAPLGVFSWYDGAGGTRMTLNSTGLGVGVVPSAGKLEVNVGAGGFSYFRSTTYSNFEITGRSDGAGSGGCQLFLTTTGSRSWLVGQRTDTTYAGANSFFIRDDTGTATRLEIDTAGNVGVGVTPSAGRGAIQLSAGVGFPATQVASSDANCLDDYKEATWSPVITAGSGTPTTVTVNSAVYTKVGRVVVCTFDFSIVNKGTASSSLQFGLPVTSITSTSFCGSFREDGSTGYMGMVIYSTGTTAGCLLYNNATPWVDGYRLKGTYTYFAA